MTDTSAEAVERLAEHITRGPHEAWELVCAATLRALVAERDAALAREAKLLEALREIGRLAHRVMHSDATAEDAVTYAEAIARAMLAALAEAPR